MLTSITAVKRTWLSPHFDRRNVLSGAIKVSPVFAQRDGWQFDECDKKLYMLTQNEQTYCYICQPFCWKSVLFLILKKKINWEWMYWLSACILSRIKYKIKLELCETCNLASWLAAETHAICSLSFRLSPCKYSLYPTTLFTVKNS